MNTVKSIKPKPISCFTEEYVNRATANLSPVEIEQLGIGRVPNSKEWTQFRDFLLKRSLASNPNLDVKLTAFTPGETKALCKMPIIHDWHQSIRSFSLPDCVDTVIFVPCAKTKPWLNVTRGIYKAYNQIREDYGSDIYFVTISEPLAIVPQDFWGSFPMYDNPGLFKDVTQRSGGLFTRDFIQHFGRKLEMPWDEDAYNGCISLFSGFIADFIANNTKEGRTFISFVNDFKGLSTHQDMLIRSGAIDESKMFLKRDAPRKSPYCIIDSYLRKNR